MSIRRLPLDRAGVALFIASAHLHRSPRMFNRRAILQGSAAALALQALPAVADTPEAAADALLSAITEEMLSD